MLYIQYIISEIIRLLRLISKAPLIPYVLLVDIALKTFECPQSLMYHIPIFNGYLVYSILSVFGSDLKILYSPYNQKSRVEENLGVMEASLMVGSLWNHTSAVRSIMSDAVVLNTEYWNPLGSFKNTCVLAAPRLRGPRH